MSAESPSNNQGRDHADLSPMAPLAVDPHAEQERLVTVSGHRADVYGVQANVARLLQETLGQTEAERRYLDELRAELIHRQLPASVLLDLTSMIRRGASLHDLFQRVLEQSVSLFESDKSSILVPDEAGLVLRVAASRSLSGEINERVEIPIGEGIAGRVFATGETMVVENTAECPEFFPHSSAGSEAKYLVAVPLEAEGEVLGVLCLERPLGLPAPPERIEQLTAYASHAAIQLRNVNVYERLAKQVEELSVLCDVSRDLSSSLQHENLLQKIVNSSARLLECGICSLMLFDDDKQTLRIRYAVGLPPEVVERATVKPGEGVSGYVAEQGEALLIEDITRDERFRPRADGASRKYTTRSLLSVPLLIGTEVVGVLNVNNKANNAVFTAHDLTNLTMLASQAAVSIENARLYETLQRLAVTDPLTKLFRRNYFEDALLAELGRCIRYDRPVSVMMLDIDHFKKINDTYGHQVGDQVLVGLAGLLRRHARKDDVVARYGGEEFIAYLVETDEEGAKMAGERIRSAAEAQVYPTGDGRQLRLTISVGTASFPGNGDDLGKLIQHADLALYAAKHGGRNRVCSYHEGLTMPAGEALEH